MSTTGKLSVRPFAPLLFAVAMAVVGLVALAARARAQTHAHAAEPGPAMSRTASLAMLHMEMTPHPKGDAADSARAAGVARTLRAALLPFRDTAAAVAAGYHMFAPELKQQRIYHFTSNWRAVQEGFRFEPAKPTSLLYTKGADGAFILMGAMYTAPRRFGYDRLDARVPLSIARWHRHVNWCTPKRGAKERWLERVNGDAMFGPESPIASQSACDAVGGVFRPVVFGWMLHANVFAGDDPAVIWGDEHAGHDMTDGMKGDSGK